MSASGVVTTRFFHPVPAPTVHVATVLAAKSKSDAWVVTAAAVLLVVVVPLSQAATSIALTVAPPLSSRTRKPPECDATMTDTTTSFYPAAPPLSLLSYTHTY